MILTNKTDSSNIFDCLTPSYFYGSRFYCIIPGLIGLEVGSFVVCVGAIPAQAQGAGIGGVDGVRCKTARFRLSLVLYARILKQVDLVKTQFTTLVYFV